MRIGSPKSLFCILLIVCSTLLALSSTASSHLPFTPGDVVATCMAELKVPLQPSSGFKAEAPVVGVIDASAPGIQLPATNWLAPMFHNDASPDAWTAENLGQVFGVALGEGAAPDIYVTAGSVYFLAVDPAQVADPNLTAEQKLLPYMYGPLGPGGVYRLRGTDGAICYHAKLPNSGPGLGNVAYDREHDQLFVSNFEDGLVYRLPAGGACVTDATKVAEVDPTEPGRSFDHGSARVNATHAVLPPLIDDDKELIIGANPPAPDNCRAFAQSGFTQLGRRTWAVQVHEGRLFYSVWNEDQVRDDPVEANEIWSVAILPGGALGAVPHLELRVPRYRGDWSSPVSDLAFGDAGHMLLAERGRCRDYGAGNGNLLLNAHQARVLEWAPRAGLGWDLVHRVPLGDYGNNDNSAGGVDYGFGYSVGPQGAMVDDESCDTSYWMSGDALLPLSLDNYVYGIQASPRDGRTGQALLDNSYYIDLDADLEELDKALIGDVEAFRDACLPQPCLDERSVDIQCLVDENGMASGEYTWTFRIRNESGGPIHHLFFIDLPQGVKAEPEHLVLDPPVGNDRVSQEQTVTFSGDLPSGSLGLRMTIHDEDLVQCCAQSLAVELPDCSCAQLVGASRPFCTGPDGVVTVKRFDFDLQNLSGVPVEYLFVTPVDPGDLTTPVSNDSVTVTNPGSLGTTVQSGETTGPQWIDLDGPGTSPGSEVCLRLSTHDRLFRECCSIVECMTIPRCGPPQASRAVASCPVSEPGG